MNTTHRPSRSERKRKALSLQQLGERLVEVPEDVLRDFGLPDDLYRAVTDAKTMRSHEARRRQMQHIGTLMRGIDPLPVRQALADWSDGKRHDRRQMEQIRGWRDGLVDGTPATLTAVLAALPSIDRPRLAHLIRETRRERELSRPPRAFRELFRFLRSALETQGTASRPSTNAGS